MKKTTLLLICLFFITIHLQAQVPYTANDQVTPYTDIFRPGVNPGYYGSYKNDALLTNIAGGNPVTGNEGVGVRTLRASLPEFITLIYDYQTWDGVYKYYDALGMKENTLIVGFAHPDHADPIQYCDGIPTDMFANLYEPIFDGGLNGTPINENNYFARYMWDLLETMGEEVKFWEIWNEPGFDYTGALGWLEPGFPGNWWENNPEPCDYKLRAPIFHFVRTLRIAYQVIKTHSPDDYVVLSGVGFESFLDAVLRNTDNPADGSVTADYPLGGGAYFDVMGFHSYPHFDGSMRYWDNNIGGFAYERHSDRGVDGFLEKRAIREANLANYGYDGVTYPEKVWMITEYNVPRVAFPDPSDPNVNLFGSDEGARNFIIKSVVAGMKEGLIQVHPYQIAERETAANADDSFDHMGFFELFEGIEYENQNVHQQGIGYKTTTELLFGTEYDANQSAAMNIPSNMNGGAFKNSLGQFVYVLWAKTTIDNSEIASGNYSFPSGMNIGNLIQHDWDYGQTGTTTNISSQNIALTGAPIFLIPNANTPVGNISLSCPVDSANISIIVTQQEGGTTYAWNTPTAATTCPLGGLTITQTHGQASGSFFSIGGDVIAYEATDACGNKVECAFTIGVASSGGGIGDTNSGCHASREGFVFIGNYGGHKYFVSIEEMTYAEGQLKAQSHGGYLASINSAGENNYLSFWGNAQAFIGYNDIDQEGNEVWHSGEPIDYTNFEDASCTWCEPNSEINDAVEFHPWNGKWNWVPATDTRTIILEIPCAETLGCECPETNEPVCGSNGVTYLNACEAECAGIFNYLYGSCDGSQPEGIFCPSDITVDATSADGAIVNYALPTTSSNECTPGSVMLISGLASGEIFPVGTTEVLYNSFFNGPANVCQNLEFCSFNVTVLPFNGGGGGDCPEDIPGFSVIGEFGNSKYYLSNDIARPVDAQAEAETHGGYLATVSSIEENNFIQAGITEMTYIGLNDYDSEGNFEWFNGESFSYDNIDPCGFCNENSEEMDFLVMAPWDGKWSFSNFFNNRPYVMEIPCDGTPPNSEITLTCPDDIVLTLPEGVAAMEVNYDNPIASTTCPQGGLTLDQAGVMSGETLTAGTHVATFHATDACGNNQSCSFNITLQMPSPPSGECPQEIAGFTVIGEFGNSKYYLSNDVSRPVDAQALAETYGGYLAAIGSKEENDFIQAGIGEMTYIGLNDYDVEESLEWFNGEALTYNNVNPCGFCNSNSEEMDFVVMAPWDGTWSFSNFFNNRPYVMEIPCQETPPAEGITISNCPGDITVTGLHINNYSETVTWQIPTATTTCAEGGLTITQVAGLPPGEDLYYPTPSGFPIVYEFTDACGNSELCISFIYVVPEDPIYTCPSDITVEATSSSGAIVNYDPPNLTSYCGSTLPDYDIIAGLASGNEFPIGTTTVQLSNILLGGAAFCQYSESCTFTITVVDPNSGGGGCPTSISEFTSLGEFGNSAYFLSNDVSRPVDAEAVANTLGGHLATINSEAENNFLHSQISELVYIGLNDYGVENTLEWYSGDAVNYTNFDICGFCNSNSADMDFVVMHGWNGGWSWSNFWNQRKYIVEIPCTQMVQNPETTELHSNISTRVISDLTLEKIIPNPAMDYIFTQIKTTEEELVEILIFDARGVLKKSEQVRLFKGLNTTRLDIADLPAGVYFVQVPQAVKGLSNQRFVKVKE